MISATSSFDIEFSSTKKQRSDTVVKFVPPKSACRRLFIAVHLLKLFASISGIKQTD